MTYHYTECGLDYIFLKNGYTMHETPYGEGVSFDDIEKMNEGIAKVIILNKPVLEGQDLKFLRTVINLTQTTLAELIGITRGGIAKAEAKRSENLTPQMDKLVRIFALKYIDDRKIRALIDKLGNLEDLLEDTKIEMLCVQQGEDGWELCAA